jgi:hypothetical protein
MIPGMNANSDATSLSQSGGMVGSQASGTTYCQGVDY